MPENTGTSSPAFQHSLPACGTAATEWVLATMFGAGAAEAWVTAVSDPDLPRDWSGGRYAAYRRAFEASPATGHYMCIANLLKGSVRRTDENVASVAGIVFDDVGTLGHPNVKLDIDWFKLLPPPTYTIETSDGNFQVGYVFEPEASAGAYERFIDALKLHPTAADGIRDGTSLVRYVRLPSGINPKPGRNGFKTRLIEGTGIKYSIPQLRAAFGLAPDPADSGPAAGTGTGTGGTAKTNSSQSEALALALPPDEALALIRDEILPLIPNRRLGRDDWCGISFAIWNGSRGHDDAEQVWEKYTLSRAEGRVDIAKDRKDVWESRLGTLAGVTTFLRLLAQQQTPAAQAMIARIKSIQAKGAFGPSGPKAIPELDWDAAKRGRVRTIQPTIFPGLDRGLLTVIGGPSGVLKSTYLMHIAVAVVCERPDILGLVAMDFCGDVIVFANEDPEEITDKRLDAIQKRWGITGFKHKLYVLSGSIFGKAPGGRDERFIWRREVHDQIMTIVAQAKAAGRQIALIAIDTLTSAAESNEETNREMQQIANLTRGLIEETGSAGLFVHHLRKAGTAGTGNREVELDLDALRGGSALGNSVRNVMFMTKPTKTDKQTAGWDEDEARKHVKLRIVKRSHGHEGEPAWFNRELVPVMVIDPRDSSLHSENYVVLVPEQFDKNLQRMGILRRAHTKIMEANQAGKELVAMSQANKSDRSVQTLLGMSDAETGEILVDLLKLHAIRIEPGKGRGRKPAKHVIAEVWPDPFDPDVNDVRRVEEDENSGL